MSKFNAFTVDDTILKVIKKLIDTFKLQPDLNKVYEWTETFNMEPNRNQLSTCAVWEKQSI